MAEVKKIKVENTKFEEKQIADNYLRLFLRVTRKAPVSGLTIEQMINQKELIDYLIAADKEKFNFMELTPSQIKTIKDKVNKFPWAVHSDELITLFKYLESLA